MKISLFVDNYTGYKFIELLIEKKDFDYKIYTYHPNFKRSQKIYDFSKFAKYFNITYLASNRYENCKTKIKNCDFALCIDWTKDFFTNSNYPFCTLYYHPSLLPMYRGYGAISEQFYRGVVKSGLTIYLPNEKVDAGDIIYQKKINIQFTDYPVDFINKCIVELYHFLNLLKNNQINLNEKKKQNENLSFYLVRKRQKDALIDFNKSAYAVYNHIRAFSHPFFGAHAFINSEKFIIWKCAIEKWEGNFGTPGEVIEKNKNGIEIACGSGSIFAHTIEINNQLFKYEDIPIEKNSLINQL
ncbi:formyl transferase [Deferribacter autotrophicus]|uniref:Methionyl-tRNA formyltransferase n=1 Tax=Deferribacter autotrophicus TaxID=500465 RepID=A0A5A8F325_9BACT|nr:formyltransferase family protein [Deferribacter autotrophicus]KAA0257341.1 formyl transferase [Deferribacter autotrophicus]